MNLVDIKEVDFVSSSLSSHWYYKSKSLILEKICPKNVISLIDVGAGSGFFSKHLLVKGLAEEAVCVDINYEKNYDEIIAGKNIFYRKDVSRVDAQLILLMDVLEHVDEPLLLLADYLSKVPSGATVIVTVPAFQFMWSDHDVYLEHKKRYRLNEVREIFKEVGLKLDESFYYYGLVFPFAFLTRFFGKFFKKNGGGVRSQLTEHNFFVNWFLYLLCLMESIFFRKNKIVGLTVFCVGHKI